jgi:hypothetical protein
LGHHVSTRPFNLHFHWGARDMAGFPPRKNGYFVEKSTTRSLRAILNTLVATFPEVDPVCFLLLPASIFMLCPTSAHPRDVELLSELINQVRKIPPDQGAVDAATRSWLSLRSHELSQYFLRRFHPRHGILHAKSPAAASKPIEASGFGEITIRQACMIVGALVDLIGNEGAA